MFLKLNNSNGLKTCELVFLEKPFIFQAFYVKFLRQDDQRHQRLQDGVRRADHFQTEVERSKAEVIIPSNTNNAMLVNLIFTVPRFDSAGGKMKYLTMTDPKKVSLLNFLSSNHKFWKFVDAGNTLLSLLLL